MGSEEQQQRHHHDLFNLHSYVSQKKRLREYMADEGMVERENEHWALPKDVSGAQTGFELPNWLALWRRNNNNPANAAAAARPAGGGGIANALNAAAVAVGLRDDDVVGATR